MPDQTAGGPLTERPSPPRITSPSVANGVEGVEVMATGGTAPVDAGAGDGVDVADDLDVGAGPRPDDADAPGEQWVDGTPPARPADAQEGRLAPPVRRRPVAVAVEMWREELARTDVQDTLLASGPEATAAWLDLTQAHPNGLAQLFAARPTRLSSLFREPAAHAAARRLAREIRASALLLAAESGVNGSCLAIGTATWHEAGEPYPVLAPLVLRGCGVRPRGAGHEDYDLDLDDAVVINPEMLRMLADSYGVDADGGHLAALTAGHKGFDPRPVYAWLEERCADVPGFRVDRSLTLATFSSGSGAMLADLDAAVPAIASHDLLARISRALVSPPPPPAEAAEPPERAASAAAAPRSPGGSSTRPAATTSPAAAAAPAGPARPGTPVPAPVGGGGDARRLAMIGRLGPRGVARPIRPPQEPDPEHELLVLDLDPAQRAAVEATMGSGHVVVEGPPGSGGTQVAAAAVAGLVATGRRVLILSPRRSSTEAILRRLGAAGMGDLVLDLQDAAGGGAGAVGATPATIRAALAAAGREGRALVGPVGPQAVPAQPGAPTLELRGDGSVPAGAAARLRRARELLDGDVEALHEVRAPWSVSVYQAIVALSELRARTNPPGTGVRIPVATLESLDAVMRERMRVHIQAAARAGAFTYTRVETRWFDAKVGSESQARTALDAAVSLRSGLERAREIMAAVTADAGLRPSPDAAGWIPLLDLLLGVRATVDQLVPEVYEQPLDDLIDALAPRGERVQQGVSRADRRRLRRQAQNLVRPGVHVPRLHALLRQARAEGRQWAERSVDGETPRVVVGLPDAAAAVDQVSAALAVLAAAFDGTETPDPRRMPLDELEQRVYDLAGDAQGILGQPRRATLLSGLRSAGLGDLIDDLRDRRVEADAVDAEFDLAWWSSVLEAVVSEDPRLLRRDPEAIRAAAADLRAAEAELIADGARRVRDAVLARARGTLTAHVEQARVLRDELLREDRPPRLVDLVRRAGDALGALCPVWVMSPDTVAACLPLPVPAGPVAGTTGTSADDTSAEDRAARAGLIDTVLIDDAGHIGMAEVAASLARCRRVIAVGDRRRQVVPTGSRSVLEALAPFATECRLDRDHRARDGRVLVPLGPRYPEGWQLTPGVAVAPPLRLETVTDGIAVPLPGEETPLSADAEVRRVVDLVAAHAARHPDESLAVVTFGERHAERIEETLRTEVPDRPGLARWLAEHWRDGADEPLVIGPPQRLLGVERDAVIVAVGLARTPHGRVLHRFDVLDSEHGASLLLMAMSRSRRRTTVVTCFTGDDLVVDRLRTGGARLLRDVLLASSGRGAASAGRSSAALDGLVADLRDRLATAGVPVHSRVGDGAWPLDIAVADLRIPGRMLVAIDIDGPDFASRSARERERQRPERWERAGWAYCKVSALDLFRDPALEVERVRSAWHAAMSTLPVTTEIPAAADGSSPVGRAEPGIAAEPGVLPDAGAVELELRAVPHGGESTEPAGDAEQSVHAPTGDAQEPAPVDDGSGPVSDGTDTLPAEPGDAEPGDAEPGDAEPGDAEPGDAEPARPADDTHGVDAAATSDAPVIPARAADDSDVGWGGSPPASEDDDHLLRERPPHYE